MSGYLVTGGTGSMGQALTRHLLTRPDTQRVCVYSRDEWKQHQMRGDGLTDERVRWFLGDVRDRDRLRRAMQGVQTVIHTAALKQVPACEYNPLEAVRTNVDGTSNVIEAALDSGVAKVLMLSSDKAVDPVNLYGATKLVAEKLMIDANVYGRNGLPRFACTRYGNVVSSRGSVLPLFQSQHARGQKLTITNPGMTRFVLTLDQAVEFVLARLDDMVGGEVFVPQLPAVTVRTIADAVTWPATANIVPIGTRAGEKHHEVLVSQHESVRAVDRGGYWCIHRLDAAVRMHGEGEFSSLTARRLDIDEFRALAGLEQPVAAAA